MICSDPHICFLFAWARGLPQRGKSSPPDCRASVHAAIPEQHSLMALLNLCDCLVECPGGKEKKWEIYETSVAQVYALFMFI